MGLKPKYADRFRWSIYILHRTIHNLYLSVTEGPATFNTEWTVTVVVMMMTVMDCF